MADGGSQPMTTNTSVLVRLIPFVAMVFIAYLTVGIPLAALTLYVGGALGYGTVTVGWTIGIQSIATLLTRKFAADVTDTRGPRRSVIAGIAVIFAAGIFYLVSTVIHGSPGFSLAILLLGRIGIGIGESLMVTGSLTWGIGTVGQANAGKVMTWNGIAMYMAIAVGAPLGLVIMRRYGFMAYRSALWRCP